METSNPHWAYTTACYVAIGVAAGVWYFRRSSGRQGRQAPQRAPTTSQFKDRQQGSTARTKRRDGRPSASDGSASERASKDLAERRRKNKKPAPPANPFEVLRDEAADNEPQENTDDLEYAENMANLRKGNKLAPPARVEGRSKTVKQSSANSANSSMGADGDDDLFLASRQATEPSEVDVSDMLEPIAPAPSVLKMAPKAQKPEVVRETGWETVEKPRREAPKIAPSADVESKKQRQNKKKNEEQKAMVEEAERNRQQKLERQRRSAREARGEAAKDGLSHTAPAVNQWNERRINGNAVQAPATSALVATLDTYDNDGASTASSKDAAPTWSPKSESTANTSWEKDLPDEEEQLRLIREQDDSTWNTVTDKKKKRKQAKADQTSLDGSGKENVEVTKASGLNGINGTSYDPSLPASDDDAGWSVA